MEGGGGGGGMPLALDVAGELSHSHVIQVQTPRFVREDVDSGVYIFNFLTPSDRSVLFALLAVLLSLVEEGKWKGMGGGGGRLWPLMLQVNFPILM